LNAIYLQGIVVAPEKIIAHLFAAPGAEDFTQAAFGDMAVDEKRTSNTFALLFRQWFKGHHFCIIFFSCH
jgi:hypothetical protein